MEKGPALPKNVRQIGEISGREKVCIEDYVMTWIHKREQQEDKGYLGIFFGEQQEAEDSVYVFIRGVFEIPAEIQEPQQQEALRGEFEKYFGDWSVQGCCVIGAYPTERMKTLGGWLPESGKLIYHLQDQEETLYRTEEEQYRRLRGYFVFYEQNKQMQEYLLEVFKDNNVEKESVPDRAIRSFREKVKEKGELKQGSFLRMASSFFVIAILIIGAIVVNRIEDIRTVRNLVSTEGTPVFQPQAEGENGQSSGAADDTAVRMSAEAIQYSAASQSGTQAPGDAQTQEAAAESGGQGEAVAAGSSGQSEAAAAGSSGQYDAIQKAEQEAALPGSEAFWEKSDLEDATEQTREAAGAAVQNNSDTASATANLSDSEAAGAAVQNNSDEASATANPGDSEATGAAAQNNAGEASTTANLSDSEATGAAAQSSADAAALQTQSGAEAGTAEPLVQDAVAVRHAQAGYVIREGDTLAKICSRYYGSIDRIAEVCEVNGIEDANVIMPGQRIVLP